MTWILLYSWLSLHEDAIKTSVRDYSSEEECLKVLDIVIERFKEREIRAICIESDKIFELIAE